MKLAGLFAKVIRFARRSTETDAKVDEVFADKGSALNSTASHCADSGDDSPPLPDDTAVLVCLPRAGDHAAVAYVDTHNEGIALPGEKRIYGRDTDGRVVNQLHLKRDGAVFFENDQVAFECSASGAFSVANAVGGITLNDDGSVEINGLVIDAAGNLVTGGSVESASLTTGAVSAVSASVGGIPFAAHTHGGVTAGSASTGPPAAP